MLAFLMLLLAAGADAHGYLFEPMSRQRQASDTGLDFCPHCVLAAPMKVDEGRGFPGDQAFAEPGKAPSVTHVSEAGTIFGVCGANPLGGNDYNVVQQTWGSTVVKTVTQGEVIDVSWCVNADHGGVYNYRLCDDKTLTDALRGTGAPPTQADQEKIEACFQRGLLRCDDVASNNCDIGPACQSGWGCDVEGKYFHCLSGGANGDRCANTAETCNGGQLVKEKVQIPYDFPPGRTVLSWRWDSRDTVEVFAACADIVVESSAPVPAPTPSPTLTKGPTDPTPAPAPDPTPAGKDVCCWDPKLPTINGGQCNACTSYDETGWCSVSKARCEGCAGQWCRQVDGVFNPDPTPAPVPAPVAPPVAPPVAAPTPAPVADPTPKPVAFTTTEDFCCMFGTCGDCFAPVLAAFPCGASADYCLNTCNGAEFCYAT